MKWENIVSNKKLVAVLTEKLKFENPTPVQVKCIPEFRRNRDVIAEAPTGSGKTLAYVVPVIEILTKKSAKWTKHQIGAIVLVPNRELAIQISDVISHFLDETTPLTKITFIGGKKADSDAAKFQEFGGNIVVSTPGRLNDLLEKEGVFKDGFDFKTCLKSVEVLVLDEADRLFEATFQNSLTNILEHLPKQKRVGLFSATQSTYEDELKKVSLRNPLKITVKAEDDEGSSSRTPIALKNYFTATETFSKFATLCRFIKSHRKCKILLFVSTCACADYFGRLFKHLILPKKPKRFRNKNQRQKLAQDSMQILAIHGKKREKRGSIFGRFRSAKNSCLLVCTDVMARGIDVPDIDWVVQYDVPRNVNFFLHRCGRTARSGQSGNSLLFLLPSETDYLDFLKRNQEIKLEKLDVECEAEYAEKVFSTVRDLASKDRSLLIKGTKAFVSYIQSYERHDCNIICHVKDLDIVNLAHAFGLLRLPRLPELKGRDLSGFRHCDVKTWSIPFTSEKMEEKRQETIKEKAKEREEKKSEKLDTEKSAAEKSAISQAEKPKKTKRKETSSEDLNEIQDDYKLLKKFKKGKITKAELEDKLLG